MKIVVTDSGPRCSEALTIDLTRSTAGPLHACFPTSLRLGIPARGNASFIDSADRRKGVGTTLRRGMRSDYSDAEIPWRGGFEQRNEGAFDMERCSFFMV